MDELIKQIPPHSLEAEQMLIGVIIFEPKLLDDILVLINENDFYHPDLKIIFVAIKKLRKIESAIDLVTIKESLREDLPRIGGLEYLTKLVMKVSTSAYYKDYCKIIKEKSYARSIIKYAMELKTKAYSENILEVQTLLASVPTFDFVETTKHKSTLDILQGTVDDIFKRMQSETTDLRGLPTGIPKLDKATGGLKSGELIGIKAGPNIGKSVLAVNICQSLAKLGYETGYFAYEMVAAQFGYRIATSEMKVPISALVNPKEGLKDNAKYLNRIKNYEDQSINNIHIFSSEQLPNKNIQEIESRLRIFPNIKLIVVDYLQLMKHPTCTSFEAYTENTRDLKALAAKYYIPIILILGENKDGSIRGTNEIEHDLDQLYEITRDKNNDSSTEREKASINNKKGRDGKLCKAPVKFFEDYIVFKEIDKDANTN